VLYHRGPGPSEGGVGGQISLSCVISGNLRRGWAGLAGDRAAGVRGSKPSKTTGPMSLSWRR